MNISAYNAFYILFQLMLSNKIHVSISSKDG
jgi:hypothetical protein